MPAPATNHTITVSLNLIDRTSLLRADSLYIHHSLTNDTSVAEFDIKGGTYTPSGWQPVSISIDGTVVFGGFITECSATVRGTGSTKQTDWHVQCRDWTILFDMVSVNERYSLEADYLIINDLFSTYLAREDFSYEVGVTNVANDLDIAFDRISFRDALNQLADRAGATWYIAPDQTLYWDTKTGFAAAAFNIDTDSPNNTTSFDVAFDSVKRDVDESEIVNLVKVMGGKGPSPTRQTDSFGANGSKSKFGALTKPVAAMWSVTYTADANTYTVYATQIGYTPNDTLIADGGQFGAVVDMATGTVYVKHTDGTVPDASTSVVVSYYYTIPIEVTVEDLVSQAAYDHVFERFVYDVSITSQDAATQYGQRLIDQYSTGKETISFTSYKHGLLPGTMVTVTCDAVGLTSPGTSFVIQEVQIHPVMSQQGNFMIVADVTCGDKKHTILEVIRQAAASSLTAGPGVLPTNPQPGNLSTISQNLGEVVSGRGLFTDGGTAQFSWSNYGGHTGAVIGLEDINGFAYGATYILESGTIRAKLGRMTGLPNVGTVPPSGWGLYTTNGFFQGIVAAGTVTGNQIIGGTIAGVAITGNTITGGTINGGYISGGSVVGGYISGGTINGAVGNIGGFVIAANQLYSNGGTISTGSVVNSSNPGVLMGTAGLFGYGTLGLTFALYSDPSKSPWFSSGTINNAVYEVYESAVIRTNADVFVSGGIQIDNSGIFAVNPTTGASRLLMEDGGFILTEDGRTIAASGVNFMVDATTGNLWAESAFLSGTVFAQAGVFTGTVFAAAGSFTGTVYASDGSFSGTVNASAGSFTGTVSASAVTGGTITGAVISGNSISGGTVSGGQVVGGTVSGALVSGGTVSGVYINGGSADFLSGSISIRNGQGLNFDIGDWGGSGSPGTVPSYIRWNLSGDPYTYIGSRWLAAASKSSMDLVAGYPSGTNRGDINIIAEQYVSSVETAWSEVRVAPGVVQIMASGTPNSGYLGIVGLPIAVYQGSVVAISILPLDTNAYTLGTTTSGYKALFLHDGTDEWKITINSSGVLQTVKV